MKQDACLAFIGGGRISWLLLESLKRKNALPHRVIVSDPNPDALEKIHSISPLRIECVTDNKTAAQNVLVFLAVHPPVVKEVADEISDNLMDDTIVVSLVPIMTIAKLTNLLGGFNRLVRMIPNAPSIIHKGYNPVVFSDSILAGEKSMLMDMFNHWGETPEVDEKTIEAYAIITGMGPTYFWPQWMELKRLGIEFGLSDEELYQALPAMLLGAVDTLFQSGLSEAEAMDLIPIYPLKESEGTIKDILNSKLGALYQKLTGN